MKISLILDFTDRAGLRRWGLVSDAVEGRRRAATADEKESEVGLVAVVAGEKGEGIVRKRKGLKEKRV